MAENVSNGDVVKKHRHLSPEDRYQIFLEATRGDVPVAEVLRKWDIHSSDLKRIRETVKSGALKEFRQGLRTAVVSDLTRRELEGAKVDILVSWNFQQIENVNCL